MAEWVPSGRYAVDLDEFRRRLVMVDGRKVRFLAPDGTSPRPLRGVSQRTVLDLIREDRVAAAVGYAVASGRCCMCGRQLKAEESLIRSIGPICYSKFGEAFSEGERDRMVAALAESKGLLGDSLPVVGAA